MRDVWQAAESYEAYIGRWSRQVARGLVAELSVAPGSVWLEVGCGSGALTETVLVSQHPSRIHAVDRSIEFVKYSRHALPAPAATFAVADAVSLPFADREMDAAVSGLVLNFVAKPELAVREMLRCLRLDGIIAVYLWDYAAGMQLIRFFWDAAAALNPAASDLDEAERFPLCQPAALEELLARAGVAHVNVSAITVPTKFRNFEELWAPFLGGQGPAPAYAASLPKEECAALREKLHGIVPKAADGSIALTARAWVARGIRQS